MTWKFDEKRFRGPDGPGDKQGGVLVDWFADFDLRDERDKWAGTVITQFAIPTGADREAALMFCHKLEAALNA